MSKAQVGSKIKTIVTIDNPLDEGRVLFPVGTELEVKNHNENGDVVVDCQHDGMSYQISLNLLEYEVIGAPLYAERDTLAQGQHYVKHASAMTTEGLHAKSAIAAELAHRDILLEEALHANALMQEILTSTKHEDNMVMAVEIERLNGVLNSNVILSPVQAVTIQQWMMNFHQVLSERKPANDAEQEAIAGGLAQLGNYIEGIQKAIEEVRTVTPAANDTPPANICPVCKGDKEADVDELTLVTAKLAEYGLKENIVDPGGRQFTFENGKQLRIYGECDTCDILAIEEFLKKETTADAMESHQNPPDDDVEG